MKTTIHPTQKRKVKDAKGGVIDLDIEKIRVHELFAAFDNAVRERVPIHQAAVWHAAIN
jgi:hypothetical protein